MSISKPESSAKHIRPVFFGDTLRAQAREVSRGRSSGIYDVSVSNLEGKTCVEMRGFSRRIKGTLF